MMRRTDPKIATSLTSLKASGHKLSFHYNYILLCQGKNMVPLPALRMKDNNVTVLKFHGDKLGAIDWQMFASALKTDNALDTIVITMLKTVPQINHEIDTEVKIKNYCRGPVLFTKFVYFDVMQALVEFINGNTTLKQIGLTGFPLKDFVGSLANAISTCKILRELSLSRSCIENEGCELICNALKYLDYIQKIDFSSCGITQAGAKAVATLIQFRKIHNDGVSWLKSLRYQDVDTTVLPCLFYINLSDNMVGDDGAKRIIEMLMDDSFVKELAMENCNLTDESVAPLIKCLEINKNICEFNLERNPGINRELYQNIRAALEKEHKNMDKIDMMELPKVGGVSNKQSEIDFEKLVKHLEDEIQRERNMRTKIEEDIKYVQQLIAQKQQEYDSLETIEYAATPATAEPSNCSHIPTPKSTQKIQKHQPHESADADSPAGNPKVDGTTRNEYLLSSTSTDSLNLMTKANEQADLSTRQESKAQDSKEKISEIVDTGKFNKKSQELSQRPSMSANFGVPSCSEMRMKRCSLSIQPSNETICPTSRAPPPTPEEISSHSTVSSKTFISSTMKIKNFEKTARPSVRYGCCNLKIMKDINKRKVSQSDHALYRKRNLQLSPVIVERNVGDSEYNTVRKPSTLFDQRGRFKRLQNFIKSKTFVVEKSRSISRSHARLQNDGELSDVELTNAECTSCCAFTTDIAQASNDLDTSDEGQITLRPSYTKFKGLKTFLTKKMKIVSSQTRNLAMPEQSDDSLSGAEDIGVSARPYIEN